MIKKVIEGYIARTDPREIVFSNQPMRQSGFFGDGDVWYSEIETDENFPVDFRVDMHEYMDIPELTKKESPRRCTITIEVGEFVGEKLDADFIQKRERIRSSIWALAEGTGRTFEEAKEIMSKSIPDIAKYLED